MSVSTRKIPPHTEAYVISSQVVEEGGCLESLQSTLSNTHNTYLYNTAACA